MSSANAPGSSSLRPAWYKGAGGQGGRGFQPPPTVTSDRGEKSRSSSWGSQERRDSNKFSALQDDEDGPPVQGGSVGKGGDGDKPSGNSRSEAFRSSFNRSNSTGQKPPGRSLADLAARMPEAGPGTRRSATAPYERGTGGSGSGRFTSLRTAEGGIPPGIGASTVDTYKPDPKVIRFTREKLLSMRPPTHSNEEGPPAILKHMEGSVIVSLEAQDPVCWDTLDAEEIWATATRDRRLTVGTPKAPPPGVLRSEPPEGIRAGRGAVPPPSAGRWRRGVALPPTEEGAKRREKDADNPNELWDDPIGGSGGAASDFSAFGGMLDDSVEPAGGDTFDFDKMAEASRKLEEEMRGASRSEVEAEAGDALGGDDVGEGDEDEDDEFRHTVKVDPKRPLASLGTTITSGSGDDVNVFEDFDSPSEPENDSTAIRAGDADPNASSRLMKMIGVNKDAPPSDGPVGDPQEPSSNPWGTSTAPEGIPGVSDNTSSGDPIIGVIPGLSTSIPSNPWGAPIIASGGSNDPDVGGMDLAARLGALATEQKTRDVHVEQRAQEAELRRRQEEEAQRRVLAQRQAEEQAYQQRAQAAAMQQQQAQNQQSQVELVLMERICAILENSWGRSDLVSILTTLHSEDSRVIPLLSNVDALTALIARSPQRVALRRDPNFAGDMAVLVLTNAQWQQQQVARSRARQEELHRREQQRRIEEEEAAARARSEAQLRAVASIVPDAPWFYSDPQNNIQGPFRGEEMRQWLEAGYFKGDLPISQQPSGPFHPLSALFPDLSVAFRVVDDTAAQEAEAARAAEEEQRRRQEEAEEEARRATEAAAAALKAEEEAREAMERERLERERQAAAEAAAAEAEAAAAQTGKGPNGGNESSTQLKMMLGLASDAQPQTDAPAPTEPVEEVAPKRASSQKRGKSGNKESQQRPVEEAPAPAPVEQPPAVSKPAAAAWGGVSKTKPKKTMSEIQQEEARAAALVAMQRVNVPRQPSSGWANVAATGTSGWSSGTLKPTATAAATVAAAGSTPPVPGARPTQAQRAKTQPSQAGGATRKVAPLSQQQRSTSGASATPADEFGASMSPALESWCKEQMQKLNGSEDLTLVAFCMTLNDASEIRQYISTYLGGTPQVNNFATEFINKRGLGSNKQEEWETPGSAKKGRKKKAGSR